MQKFSTIHIKITIKDKNILYYFLPLQRKPNEKKIKKNNLYKHETI